MGLLYLISPNSLQILDKIGCNEVQITFDGNPQDFFGSQQLLNKSNLLAPKSIQISREIGLRGLPLSLDELSANLIERLKNGGMANG